MHIEKRGKHLHFINLDICPQFLWISLCVI